MQFELIHPSWLVFADEVGSNTLQTKDRNVGGEKYLYTKQGRPQNHTATKDAHFTLLGFTLTTGESIMCTLIFTAMEMQDEWIYGFDPFIDWIGGENDIHENMGEGKAYLMGPDCIFNGKKIPCFCCCSESGSITGQLLVQMLQAMDALEVLMIPVSAPSFSSMVMEAGANLSFWSILILKNTSGIAALACHMEHRIGRLETVVSKTVASRCLLLEPSKKWFRRRMMMA